MKRIALTGGIACGKSLVAKFLNELGVETIDADDVVHELIPDPAERKRIAAEVFADEAKRRALEAKIHPIVKARIAAFLDARRETRDLAPSLPSQVSRHSQSLESPVLSLPFPLRLAIIPLLFETHWDAEYDIICCVTSDRETQISRMMATRGYAREEAEARLAAQMPVKEKAAKSHYVIENDGSREELKSEVERFVSWLKNSTYSQGR